MSELNHDLIRYRRNGFRLYARNDAITSNDVDTMLSLVASAKSSPAKDAKALYGRRELIEGEISHSRNIVVKSYHRGGFLRFCLPAVHMRLFETRCRRESNILTAVRSFGGNAPKPIAYVEEGEFLYNAWLITERIPGGVNLIDFIEKNPSKAQEKLLLLSEQIHKLVTMGIHHIDLHPGNAVVAGDGSVFIVDFDKAYNYTGKKNTLRDLYLRRWRRAVIKHRLPEVLTEMVSLALRENFEVSA